MSYNNGNGTDRQSDMWQLVDVLQREVGGGCAKAVTVTAFFDQQGRLVGRTEVKSVKLLPGSLSDLLKNLFSG